MDATKLLAFYGALVSTLAVGWNIYRDRRDKACLKLSAMLGYTIQNGKSIVAHKFLVETRPDIVEDSSPSLFITMTNTGKRPLIVAGWAIRADKKKTGSDNFIYRLTVLPKALKEAEYAVEQTSDLSLLVDGAKGIYAWDSTGKKWRLPRRELRRLQREAKSCQLPVTAGDMP